MKKIKNVTFKQLLKYLIYSLVLFLSLVGISTIYTISTGQIASNYGIITILAALIPVVTIFSAVLLGTPKTISWLVGMGFLSIYYCAVYLIPGFLSSPFMGQIQYGLLIMNTTYMIVIGVIMYADEYSMETLGDLRFPPYK